MTSLPIQQISLTQERVRCPRHVPMSRKTGFLIIDSFLSIMAPCSGINDIHFCIVQSSQGDIWTVPVNVDFATLLFYVVSRSCTVLCEYMK